MIKDRADRFEFRVFGKDLGPLSRELAMHARMVAHEDRSDEVYLISRLTT